MEIKKVYAVLLDFADENCGESGIEIIGTYSEMESAERCLREWKQDLLNGDTWEADAYKDNQENGEESYEVSESDHHFEISECFRYDSNHTYCRILTLNVED